MENENTEKKPRRKKKAIDPAEKLLDAFIAYRETMDKNNPVHRALYLGIMGTSLGPKSTFKMRKK